jgi:hypothetical protein
VLGKRQSLSIFRTPGGIETAKVYVAVTGPALALVAVLVGISGPVTSVATVLASRPGATAAGANPSAPAGGLAAAIGKATGLSGATGFSRATGLSKATGVSMATAYAKAPAFARETAFVRATGRQDTARRTSAHLMPQQIAQRMLGQFDWPPSQFRYLNLLWTRESGWDVYASNPYSGAYGIPQAVPGAKMATAGPDWTSDARTQILWGLRYIKEIYGSPLGAWEHELADGWY